MDVDWINEHTCDVTVTCASVTSFQLVAALSAAGDWCCRRYRHDSIFFPFFVFSMDNSSIFVAGGIIRKISFGYRKSNHD